MHYLNKTKRERRLTQSRARQGSAVLRLSRAQPSARGKEETTGWTWCAMLKEEEPGFVGATEGGRDNSEGETRPGACGCCWLLECCVRTGEELSLIHI